MSNFSAELVYLRAELWRWWVLDRGSGHLHYLVSHLSQDLEGSGVWRGGQDESHIVRKPLRKSSQRKELSLTPGRSPRSVGACAEGAAIAQLFQ